MKEETKNHSPQENSQSVITDGRNTFRERITEGNHSQGEGDSRKDSKVNLHPPDTTFNLSDEEVDSEGNPFYWKYDVKEFIRILKEKLSWVNDKARVYREISKLSGEKLR